MCGAVRYTVTGTPSAFDLDHCARCRKSSGSAFKAELIFEAAKFEWVSGGPLVRTYEMLVHQAPPGYRRTFCSVCGGPLPTVDREILNIPPGTLDDGPSLRPQRHIFVDFKAPWFDIADTLPRFPRK